jgi:hypothetical protein
MASGQLAVRRSRSLASQYDRLECWNKPLEQKKKKKVGTQMQPKKKKKRQVLNPNETL